MARRGADGSGTPEQSLRGALTEISWPPPPQAGKGCFVAFTLLWNAIAWSFFIGSLIGALSGEPVLFVFSAFSLIFVGVGVLLIYLCARNWLARIKITRPELTLSTESLPLGGEFAYEVSFAPKAAIDLEAFEVSLTCQEEAEYQQGTDTRTVKHVVFEDKHELMGAAQLLPGERIERKGTFRVPADGMHSFEASHNKVRWLVTVRVAIARWPDYADEVPVQVEPTLLLEG